MSASLCIAGAPYASFPGGVIVLRASDYVAGSATTAVDSLAAEGVRVQHNNQITPSSGNMLSSTNELDAIAAASDTLILDFSTIPIINGGVYDMIFTYRIVGDWGTVPQPTTSIPSVDSYVSKSTNLFLTGLVGAGMFGGADIPTVADADVDWVAWTWKRPHYLCRAMGPGDFFKTDVYHVRFFSINTVNFTWYLDQIYLIPTVFSSNVVAASPIPGQTSIGDATNYTLPLVDGADGGDDGGKYTVYAQDIGRSIIATEPSNAGFNGPGSDYQRYSFGSGGSAEYLLRMAPADGSPLQDSDGNPVNAYAYSICYVNYKEPETIADSFSRTVNFANTDWPGSLGVNPDGYGYQIGASFSGPPSEHIQADGSQVVITFPNGRAGEVMGLMMGGSDFATNAGACLMFLDHVRWSGTFTHVTGTGGVIRVRLFLFYEIRFDLNAKTWSLIYGTAAFGGTPTVFFGPVSIPWYATGVGVSYKIEVDRMNWRCRIWQTGTTEPSTWDYENFKKFKYPGDLPAAPPHDYDYTDVGTGLVHAQQAYPVFANDNSYGWLQVEPQGTTAGSFTFTVDDYTLEYDPQGSSPTDMMARLETPDGTLFSEIEVPYGAPRLIFWGQDVFTAFDSGSGTNNLQVSAKTWNGPSAPQLQKATLEMLYFFQIQKRRPQIIRYR